MLQQYSAASSVYSYVIQLESDCVDFESLEKLFGRARRLRARLGVKEGSGASWSATLENGETHRYSLSGVKAPDEVQDDIESLFVWLWSLKDHIKKYLDGKGKSSGWVEPEISADQYLSICGDLANRAKHGELNRGSRSGKFPMLGKLRYQVSQTAVSSITFGAFDVGMNIAEPRQVTLEMPILGADGRYLGDAFKYLDYALKGWEKIIDRAEKAV